MSEELNPLALTRREPQDLPAHAAEVASDSQVFRESGPGDETAVSFSHYFWVLKRNGWRILSFIAISVAATIIISARLTPSYESTATIDVDRQMPAAVVGQDSRTPVNDSDQFLSTQIRLIQSPSVLRPVAQRYKMLSGNINLSLSTIKVTRPPNTYLLLISYRSPNRNLAAEIANAVAQSYIDHSYDIRFEAAGHLAAFMQKQLEELRAKMERSSEALARFEKDLNLINPEEKVSMISSRLLQLNTEFTNAQADRVRKEATLNSAMTGALEALPSSVQGDQQLPRLIEKVNEASGKFALAKAHYGSEHPEYIKAAQELSELRRQFEDAKQSITKRVRIEYTEAINRERMLQSSLDEVKSEYDKLNAGSFQYKSLKQEAETDKSVYEELIRKIKEATINAGFQNNSIRLADPAEPGKEPVFPDTKTNVLIALLVSTAIGVGAAVISDSLDRTLRDPIQIQRQFATEVLASLPVVKGWRGRLPLVPKAAPVPGGLIVANSSVANEGHAYEEAVRTLRDSILLSNLHQRPRTLLMTSATPREGKTTTAVHLAVAHSQQRRRTLLIDADLRRPGVYRHLAIPNDVGLSDVIKSGADWRSAIQYCEAYPHLAVLPAGPPSRTAADGIGSALTAILAEALPEFDLIICDAPPLLGFAESLQIAALVDGVVVVALAGQTDQHAVASVFNSLRRIDVDILGVALNEVRADLSERYYYYGYYGRYYNKYYKPHE